jgi:hypothetical protein
MARRVPTSTPRPHRVRQAVICPDGAVHCEEALDRV